MHEQDSGRSPANSRSWRDLLGSLINNPQDRQRIAEAAGINALTLTRWATGKSNPRPDNLRPLIDALPRHRQLFTELVSKEFPSFGLEKKYEIIPEIPSAFYARALNIHTSSPPIIRSSSLCIAILQQMVAHLDPRHQGIAIYITQCSLPVSGDKVRSLRKTYGRGTVPWNDLLEHESMFFGAESLAGRSLVSRHPIAEQTPTEKLFSYTSEEVPLIESYFTTPILYANKTAGCINVLSTQTNFFSLAHQEVIQMYTELLVLAFEPHEFYPLQNISLGIMPPYSTQRPYLSSFQNEVTRFMLESERDRRPVRRSDAEIFVWQILENKLLFHS